MLPICSNFSIPGCPLARYIDGDAFDLVVLLDASGSIGYHTFSTAKLTLQNLISNLSIGSSTVRVALVLFHNVAEEIFDFNIGSDPVAANIRLNAITYPSENRGTALKGGLDYVRWRLLRSSKGYRHGLVPTKLLVMTDGAASEGEAGVISSAVALTTTFPGLLSIFGVGLKSEANPEGVFDGTWVDGTATLADVLAGISLTLSFDKNRDGIRFDVSGETKVMVPTSSTLGLRGSTSGITIRGNITQAITQSASVLISRYTTDELSWAIVLNGSHGITFVYRGDNEKLIEVWFGRKIAINDNRSHLFELRVGLTSASLCIDSECNDGKPTSRSVRRLRGGDFFDCGGTDIGCSFMLGGSFDGSLDGTDTFQGFVHEIQVCTGCGHVPEAPPYICLPEDELIHPGVYDLVMLVDTSGSVGDDVFVQLKEGLAAKTIDALTQVFCADGVQAAAAEFHNFAELVYNFTTNRTEARTTLSNGLVRIGNRGTALSAGLQYVASNILVSGTGWRGVTTKVIVYTDGKIGEAALNELSNAQVALARRGAEIYVVWVDIDLRSKIPELEALKIGAGSLDDLKRYVAVGWEPNITKRSFSEVVRDFGLDDSAGSRMFQNGGAPDMLPLLSQAQRWFGTTFAIVATVTQESVTSGYLLAKSDSIGNRFFSIFLNAVDGITIWYRIKTVVGDVDVTHRKLVFGSSTAVADGLEHLVEVHVNGNEVIACVDGSCPGPALRFDGPVADCEATDDDCFLTVGGRLGRAGPKTPAVYRFSGIIKSLSVCRDPGIWRDAFENNCFEG